MKRLTTVLLALSALPLSAAVITQGTRSTAAGQGFEGTNSWAIGTTLSYLVETEATNYRYTYTIATDDSPGFSHSS